MSHDTSGQWSVWYNNSTKTVLIYQSETLKDDEKESEMTTQIPAVIDEATKNQFDTICTNIGIHPSNAVGDLMKFFVTSNGLPVQHTIPTIGDSAGIGQKMSRKEVFGFMRGHFEMADDFDAPMEEFKEYM